jgi:hypothetical protein
MDLDSLWTSVSALAGQMAQLASTLPRLAGFALVLVGLIVAVIGSRAPIVRVVAFVAGAGLGAALAPVFAPFLHVPEATLTYALGGGIGVLGAAIPETVVFLVLGGLTGLLGASFFPPTDRFIAFLPGFLVGGAVGAIFFPWIAAALTGLAGGLAFAMGTAAALSVWKGGPRLLQHPLAMVGLGLAVGISGMIGQLNLPSEEDQAAEDADKSRKRQIRKSEKARDVRFAKYAKKTKKPPQ